MAPVLAPRAKKGPGERPHPSPGPGGTVEQRQREVVKFQFYLANVFNSNIVVEMPEELSTLIWLKHPWLASSLNMEGPGSAWYWPQTTWEVTEIRTLAQEGEGSCPGLFWPQPGLSLVVVGPTL